MELGTHNSMTYLKPKKWYMYPFQFIARCQSKTIKEQYEDYNIRLFDIRITYDRDGNPEFRHGSMAYKGDVYEVLNWLNSRGEKVKIRLLLEINKPSIHSEIFFVYDCKRFGELYPNLTFYEGRRKYDWEQVYKFPTLEVEQPVSSMDGNNKLNDLWPWLYAKKHNAENRIKYKDSKYVLMDFINE